MDVPVRTIQRWKSGKHRPQARQFYRLCKLFGHPLPPGFPVEDTTSEKEADTQTVTREERQASLVISPPEIEDACTRFLSTDLTVRLLDAIWTWSFRNVDARYHELQTLLIRELEQKDNAMQESPINRRNALRRIAALPIKLYSLSFAAPTLVRTPEEFLPRCAAGITACWYLRKGKDLAFASNAVSRYIPTLKEIVTNGKGTQCKDAAEETVRTESFTDQIMAEINRSDKPRNMEFCIDQWKKASQRCVLWEALGESSEELSCMRMYQPSRFKLLNGFAGCLWSADLVGNAMHTLHNRLQVRF